MHKIYFASDVSGVLRINFDCSHELNSLGLIKTLPNEFILEFTPFDSDYKSICEKVVLDDFSCKQLRLCKLSGSVFRIKINPCRAYEKVVQADISELKYHNKKARLIYDGQLFLSFEDEYKKQIKMIGRGFSRGKLSIYSHNNLNYLRVDCDSDSQKSLALYDLDGFNEVYAGVGYDISLIDNSIICKSKKNIMSHPIIEEVHKIEDLSCRLIEKRLINFDREYLATASISLRIFAFLESVKFQIPDLVQNSICRELAIDFNLSAYTDYFGDMHELVKLPNIDGENNITIIRNAENNIDTASRFEFEFEGEKISNFSQI